MPIRSALPCLLLMACVAQPDDEGVTTAAIIGGQQASTTDFSTVVALQHGNGNQFCSGVLVAADWVLTTASCFPDNTATQARIGDANLTDGTVSGLTITVAEIHKHPQFATNDTVWRHDVALLKLAQPVTDRAPSPMKRDVTAVGTAVTQAGFGASNNNGDGDGVLRSLATTSVDCANAGDSGITNANLMCFNAGDGTASCYGDGGAPAFVNATTGRIVAGVASGGTGSSCTQGLDIYTSLAPELAFIDTKIPPTTTPNPTTPPSENPTTPPPTNPDGTGSGSGRDPNDSDGPGAVRAVNCNAGGGAGSATALVIILLGFATSRRRSRTKRTAARSSAE